MTEPPAPAEFVPSPDPAQAGTALKALIAGAEDAAREAAFWTHFAAGIVPLASLCREYGKDRPNVIRQAKRLGLERSRGPAIARRATKLTERKIAIRERERQSALDAQAIEQGRAAIGIVTQAEGDTPPTQAVTQARNDTVTHVSKRLTEAEVERANAEVVSRVDTETKDAAELVGQLSVELLIAARLKLKHENVLSEQGFRALCDDLAAWFARVQSTKPEDVEIKAMLAEGVMLLRALRDNRLQVAVLNDITLMAQRAGGGGALDAGDKRREWHKLGDEQAGNDGLVERLRARRSKRAVRLEARRVA